MGQRVERVKTTVSEHQLATAIIESWVELFGSAPTKEQVIMVLAQNSIETGNRDKMWNYNIGNITTDGKGSFNYWEGLDWLYESLPADKTGLPQRKKKHVTLKYRAYPSLKEGVKDYLKLLSGKKYAGAWEHIVNPDIESFSKALKKIGYYTADESEYTKALKSSFDKLSKSLSKKEKPVNKDIAPKSNTINFGDQLLSTVNQYLQQIAAAEKYNKKLYKTYLPTNNYTIEIQANDTVNSTEFARILCSVLEQELLASASVYHNNDKIEVGCAVYGPSTDCFEAVQELTKVLATTFRKATIKIGGIEIKAKFGMNKKSSYQLMSGEIASNYYTKFLSKFNKDMK